jgi:hypothetical protein
MALRKKLNNKQVRRPLSNSRMTQDACCDNGLNVLARLIARRILVGYSNQHREQNTTSGDSEFEEIVHGNERANE